MKNEYTFKKKYSEVMRRIMAPMFVRDYYINHYLPIDGAVVAQPEEWQDQFAAFASPLG
jgi:hypothetical protein